MNRKGQGLPLTTIVIAIIVLVVLVLLVAIFTGQISRTDRDLQLQGNIDLVGLKLQYGKCHPTPSQEQEFLEAQNTAATSQLKADAKTAFLRVVGQCNTNAERDQCIANGCIWDE